MSLSKTIRSGMRVMDLAGGQQGGDLEPQRLEDRRW
jgi:hypothetical protein